MSDFMNNLGNYTEKVNPYHSLDAYPGTHFSITENILKLFFPLVVFQLTYQSNNPDINIICNKEVVNIDQFRYYLNYVIIPKVSEYLKQVPTKREMLNEFDEKYRDGYFQETSEVDMEKMNQYIKKNYPEIVVRDDLTKITDFVEKYYPGIVVKEDFQQFKENRKKQGYNVESPQFKIDYINHKINTYDKDKRIDKALNELKRFDYSFYESLDKIKNYLRAIYYADRYKK